MEWGAKGCGGWLPNAAHARERVLGDDSWGSFESTWLEAYAMPPVNHVLGRTGRRIREMGSGGEWGLSGFGETRR